MKITATKVPPVPPVPPVPTKPTFHVELDLEYREALAILALCRRVGGQYGTAGDTSVPRQVTEGLGDAISQVLKHEPVQQGFLSVADRLCGTPYGHEALADSLILTGLSIHFHHVPDSNYSKL